MHALNTYRVVTTNLTKALQPKVMRAVPLKMVQLIVCADKVGFIRHNKPPFSCDGGCVLSGISPDVAGQHKNTVWSWDVKIQANIVKIISIKHPSPLALIFK